ncbi:uncharacterized protein Z520_05316 [Fonsecaea multimorphosa CBS 102226]|uniref:Uncharacterized protein n=1 Tax=Fonsecaea multimorphosa CBS 102226 TaxID=1442371 RepID=A0A0D2HAF6_9EURO|nr:uncharacterized protein Z520_05316 [Fonsecaea multimorphosa CBS 102226]KIX98855.1 hypothetical protein Z520_05316 [Fonsecaea multimorphosa CBS 102226]OAL25135.1 hypothetical protein AYO22_05012 [Fonsecaea multimorphosa]
MASHHNDCHCPSCSTGASSKRTKRQHPGDPEGQQTVKVLKLSARDVFPFVKVLDAPVRLATRMAQSVNPFPIRIERNVTAPPYERGWTYVERRNGLLCVVRNRKDVWRLHRPSSKKKRGQPPPPPPPTPPRNGGGRDPEREVIIVREEDLDLIGRHHRVRPDGDRLFVEVLHERGDSGSRPRIEVRRPLNATAPPPSPTFHTTAHEERFPYRIVQKIPVERGRLLRRARPLHAYDDDRHPLQQCPPQPVDCYEEEVFDPPVDLPSREPRPYHIPEPENAVWDEDMNAWVVRRSPRVRFE